MCVSDSDKLHAHSTHMHQAQSRYVVRTMTRPCGGAQSINGIQETHTKLLAGSRGENCTRRQQASAPTAGIHARLRASPCLLSSVCTSAPTPTSITTRNHTTCSPITHNPVFDRTCTSRQWLCTSTCFWRCVSEVLSGTSVNVARSGKGQNVTIQDMTCSDLHPTGDGPEKPRAGQTKTFKGRTQDPKCRKGGPGGKEDDAHDVQAIQCRLRAPTTDTYFLSHKLYSLRRHALC